MSKPYVEKRYWYRCTSCGWVRVYGLIVPDLCFKCGDVGTWKLEKELEVEEAAKTKKENER